MAWENGKGWVLTNKRNLSHFHIIWTMVTNFFSWIECIDFIHKNRTHNFQNLLGCKMKNIIFYEPWRDILKQNLLTSQFMCGLGHQCSVWLSHELQEFQAITLLKTDHVQWYSNASCYRSGHFYQDETLFFLKFQTCSNSFNFERASN